ncbi:polyphosphate--glucose phosphotransferase [Streptomyces noursei]|uniref:polyphosphate--glucose phosphotransferase n=1 Tax=Streptomyces noursei TaxID=1971 RepID=UPI0030F1591B
MRVFGVDIGGSGIKGAPVDLERGELVDERYKVLTPHPATPEAVADCVKEVVDHFGWTGPVGATFPGVVTGGTTRTAANVDKRWIGTDAAALLTGRLGGDTGGSPVTLLNDADAAGLAEMQFGAGRGRTGTVIVLTFGTGIGSAVFIDGRLVPNTELGHLELHGHDAEKRASTKSKEDEELNWQQWAHRVQKYLAHVEMLFSPALFVIGGGVSRKAEKFLPLIEGIRAEIVPARLQNNAGIVGAAMAARPPSAAAGSPGAAQAAPATGAPPAAGGSPAGNGPGPAARTRPAQGPTPAGRAPSAAVDSPVGWPDGRR